MSVTMPNTVLRGLSSGALEQRDSYVYTKLAEMAPGGLLYFTVDELQKRMGARRQTLIASLRRLDAVSAIVYAPSNSRYQRSFIGIPNATDDFRTIGIPIGTDERGARLADQDFCISSVSRLAPMNSVATKLVNKAKTNKNQGQGLRPKDLKNSHSKKSAGGRKKKSFASDSVELRLAELLLSLIVENLDPLAKADLQVWALEIDRLNRLDERPFDDIEATIRWLYDVRSGKNAVFWRGNVLSAKSLRKQFPRLYVLQNGCCKVKHLDESVQEFERTGL